MLNTENIPKVDDDEQLARFIVYSNEYRKSDDTLRPRLFMPYSFVALSVNRHRDSNEKELWKIGSHVAEQRKRTLYGRADIKALSCRIEPLDVQPDQLPGNPNHANIIGYPPKKEDQQSLALKLAAAAGKRISRPE